MPCVKIKWRYCICSATYTQYLAFIAYIFFPRIVFDLLWNRLLFWWSRFFIFLQCNSGFSINNIADPFITIIVRYMRETTIIKSNLSTFRQNIISIQIVKNYQKKQDQFLTKVINSSQLKKSNPIIFVDELGSYSFLSCNHSANDAPLKTPNSNISPYKSLTLL